MKVKIVSPAGWMGHPKGSIVDLTEDKAVDLKNRKVGVAKKKNTKPKKDKMVKSSKTKAI